MGVLVRELGALYARVPRAARPIRCPPLPVQYADYAAWQRRWVEGEVLERAGGRTGRETLAGAPELLELPTDHPRPAQQDHAGARGPRGAGRGADGGGCKALARRARAPRCS